MTFGIPEKSMQIILKELKRQKEIQKAAIFGSRAMGNYKNGSDVDLVVFGSGVTDHIVNDLRIALNENLPLPYYFDIVHYESIAPGAFKEHIDTCSRLFYQQGRPQKNNLS
jgi:predicted nucleotidyltransferase